MRDLSKWWIRLPLLVGLFALDCTGGQTGDPGSPLSAECRRERTDRAGQADSPAQAAFEAWTVSGRTRVFEVALSLGASGTEQARLELRATGGARWATRDDPSCEPQVELEVEALLHRAERDVVGEGWLDATRQPDASAGRLHFTALGMCTFHAQNERAFLTCP